MIDLGGKWQQYLQHKPNFIRFGTYAFAIPLAAFALWAFGKYGLLDFWLLTILVSWVAGRWWAHEMWRWRERDRQSREE